MCQKTIITFVRCGHWEAFLQECDAAVKRGCKEFERHLLCQPVVEVGKKVDGLCRICEGVSKLNRWEVKGLKLIEQPGDT